MTTESPTVFQLVDMVKSAAGVVSATKSALGTFSLIDASKPARVEPLAVVSKDCATLDYLPEVMQSLLSIFTGYYLQAVALTANIDNVKVMRVLDRLNPDRAGIPSFESYKDIPVLVGDAYKFRLPRPALEASSKKSEDPNTPQYNQVKEKLHPFGTHTDKGQIGSDLTKIVNEQTNLAVGKLVNVGLSYQDKEFTIPVSIRLVPSIMALPAVLNLMTVRNEDKSLTERFHSWRAGRIRFMQDLVFCQDLLDEHKKALMSDHTGVYSEIIRRVNNSRKAGLLSMNFSMATASNIFVISEAVEKDVQNKLGGKLANTRIRNLVFAGTYAMIIAVIDRDWERVTFYFRGIDMPTEVSLKDIKKANTGKGPDIMDIFKAMQMGNSAAF